MITPLPNQRWSRVRKDHSDFKLSHYPIVPTQMLSKCSSVYGSTSLRHAIGHVSDRILSQPPNNDHMSPHVSRQRSKRSKGVRIRTLVRVKSTRFEMKTKESPSKAMRDVDNEHILNANFTRKYQPKVFADIAGHEITVRAISKAVEKMKIASLYLFYGPTGTGKTSTARIFAMALNCESESSPKPCWSCRGCSRSLFVMDLCSGNGADGFGKIKTLVQSTSFSRALPGFKVHIIKQSHLFSEEDWDELLGMAERAYTFRVVFVIVTVAANTVPLNIMSRCQKFFFPKLMNTEMTFKLVNIAASEGISIEKEPLNMIAAKAEGSLREAENLLDQLALLGSTITSTMVQQLVGLLPQNKLLDLLENAISGDAIKTMRCAKELTVTGAEPHSLVSQLAGLITDILSDDTGSASSSSPSRSSKYNILSRKVHQLENSQSERFYHALKVLVEAEKQLRCSTDHNTIVMAALLDITTHDFSNRSTGNLWPKKESLDYKSTVTSENLYNHDMCLDRNNSDSHSSSSYSQQFDTDTNKLLMFTDRNSTCQISGLPGEVKTILPNMSDMEDKWRKTLTGIQNGNVKEFLLQAKLASLTVSSGNIIVHLVFKRSEDKMAAQMSEITIRRILQSTIGCEVTLNMSVEPIKTGIGGKDTVFTKSQSYKHSVQQPKIPYLAEDFNSMGFEDAKHQRTSEDSSPSAARREPKLNSKTKWQGQNIYATEKKVANTGTINSSPFFGLQMQKDEFDASINCLRETLASEQTSNVQQHMYLSISSVEQNDASVEPYSRDIFFDRNKEGNRRKNRTSRKGFPKYVEKGAFPNRAMNQRWNYFGGCRDVLCSKQTQ